MSSLRPSLLNALYRLYVYILRQLEMGFARNAAAWTLMTSLMATRTVVICALLSLLDTDQEGRGVRVGVERFGGGMDNLMSDACSDHPAV